MQLEFLPPNTTSKIQPLDQGIIRAMKQHYRKRLLSNLVVKLESNSEKPLTEFIKTTTVLDALHFLKQAWQKVTPVCIQNCFRKAGFDLRSSIQPSLERNADDMPFNWSSLGIDEEDFDHYVTINTFHFVMHISIIKGIKHGSTNLQTHRGISCNSCKFIEQIVYCYLFCVLKV